jgi:hypothetical protein
VEAREVHGRDGEEAVVRDELSQLLQGGQRVDEVLKDVEHDDRVVALLPVELLECPFAQVDAEALSPLLDRPARRLVAGRLPAMPSGHLEE